MSEQAPSKGGWVKAAALGVLGLGGGAFGTYATAVFDRLAKPTLPVANFAVAADGLTVTCQNHATGDSGWWDFGDGTPLEPFAADKPAVTHAYAKPGTFNVKLTVRNFTSDQNDRSVAVEVAAGPKEAPAPQIAGFSVKPVSATSVAPATFRLTADVTDAEHCVFDFGDGRLEVADGTGNGKIDRLVTFEKPGPVTIQLVAHNSKAATKQAGSVKIDAAVAGTLMAVLKVMDSGTRVERVNHAETLAVPAPKDKAGPAFAKTLTPRPGFTFASADPASANTPGVRNLKVQLAADKKSAAVSGEWAGDAKGGKGTGSDVLVPLKLVEERTTAVQAPPETITGAFSQGADGRISLTLPLPQPQNGVKGTQRTMALELRQAVAAGPARSLGTVPNVKLPGVVGTVDAGSGAGGRQKQEVHARLQGDTVVLVVGY